ncbi:MAG: histidine kinase [Lachnospiraceae bacterium]|jgi:Putative regulator of cell autolysis|nr:histidine kinase [Lachnospiraceae bacterium]
MSKRENKNAGYQRGSYLFIAIACLFFLFAVVYLRASLRSIEEEMYSQMRYAAQSTADYIYYRMERASFEAEVLERTLSSVFEQEGSRQEQYEEYQEIKKILSGTLDQKVISYCRIYSSVPKIYSGQFTSNWLIADMDKADHALPEHERQYSFWKDTHEEDYSIMIGKRRVITYYRPIRSRSDYEKQNGIIAMDINISDIEGMLSSGDKKAMYLVNEQGIVLADAGGREMGEKLLGDAFHFGQHENEGEIRWDHAVFIYSQLKNTNWYLVGKIENSKIYLMNKKIFIAVSLFVIILLCIVFSLLFGIKNIQLKYRVSKVSLAAAQYQMQAMQAQIKPHFIYNILDIIKWMVLDERINDSARMLNELSHFLHLSFGKDSGIVKMSEEMEHLSAYVKLMQERYENKFEFITEIEKDTQDCLIPKFTLQPFVENALLHGILYCDKQEKRVMVRSWKDESAWYIEIEDNGKGMPQSVADRICEEKSDLHKNSYGIYNVCERLRIFTNDKCRIRIISREEVGTCVCMEFRLKSVKSDFN